MHSLAPASRRSLSRLAILVAAALFSACAAAIVQPTDGGGPAGDGGIIQTDAAAGSCVTSTGLVVPNGGRFSPDGCNTCSCSNGMLACTLLACIEAGVTETCVAPDGTRFPVGTRYTFGSSTCRGYCDCLTGARLQCQVPNCPVRTCTGPDGRIYTPGQSYSFGPADCLGVCTCQSDGMFQCAVPSCPPPPEDAGTTGNPCSTQSDCSLGTHCAIRANACFINALPGFCEPGYCLRDIAQYCSCDGRTVSGSSNCAPGAYLYTGPCRDGG